MGSHAGNEQFRISKRASQTIEIASPFLVHIQAVLGNPFDPLTNPEGIVNLGIAENKLCEDLMVEKMKSVQAIEESPCLLYYDVNSGTASAKKSAKRFIDNFLNPITEIDEKNIVIMSGLTSSLETLAFAIADSGEYIMVPSPYYFRIRNDIQDRAEVNVLNVPLQYKTDHKPSMCEMNSEILEEYYQKAISENKVVRGILLSNPNNPSGDVLTEDQLLDILEFANRHNLHVIANEIYALSVFDPEITFKSLLSLPLPNPNMVHFTWGSSKDLGLSGFRISMVYTKNPNVLSYCLSVSAFTTASRLIQHRLQEIIDDKDWLSKVFLPTKFSRMQKRYQEITSQLRQHGARVHTSGATMFIWLDLREFLQEPTFDAENSLFLKFMSEKVFVVPGKELYNQDPGMFRIVFTLDEPVIKEGIRRVIKVLQDCRRQL
ncbi:unnamed protein product [Lymnaea stagnalis]|uniref:Aminotransferase class I/classII large domain-containing protein n=1 Tax=Lymnaea stagnalis TaxID=6523 RepID=A0AAV2H2G5_LYMST